MSDKPIFYIKGGDLAFGDKQILSDIELLIYPGERISLVGRNGSGKSSLMKVIIGTYELDNGQLYQEPYLSVNYLEQDFKEKPDITVKDFILKNFKEPEENSYKVDIILENLQITPDMPLKNASGGQLRRTLLASVLVSSPDLLLLDEPTNHLDIKSIIWLEEYLLNYKGAVICISHDRAFLEKTTNRVWWIDRAMLRKSNQGFKYYDTWRDEIIAFEEANLRNMNRKLEAENSWMNGGVSARRKRNQKRLAALHRLREDYKIHQAKLNNAKAKLQIELDDEANKAKFIFEAKSVSFGYDNASLINDFSIKIQKGEKIGIVGPNGSGKTTLIKLIIGELQANSGKLRRGKDLEITYFDQHKSVLNASDTLQKTLCPTGGDQVFLKNKVMHVAAYLKNFMFDPRSLGDKVSSLSGGQANRLLLAKALIRPGNLLILDEPTNDLDFDSLEMLQELLAEYDGTLIVVSHDRDFLEKLVTRTLVFTEAGMMQDFYGGYNDYIKFYESQGSENKSSSTKFAKKNEHIASPNNSSTQKPGKTLSYKYERLLEVLPKEVEKLENRQQEITEMLADAELYQRDPLSFQNLTKELSLIEKQINDKMDEWAKIESQKLD